ncbi:MAG: alanine racemase [Methylobacteriaceae bacterium]|nr:alanine racemase [Methylobacteriaceae bacterium]
MSIIDEASAGAILTIDLNALAGNWRLLRDKVAQATPAAECAAVVKADAYGIGLEPAVTTLAKAGCRTFFVAHVSEALRVRATDRDCTLYLLNGLTPGSSEALARNMIRPVLSSLSEIEEWAAFAAERGSKPPAAIQFDTGINRLGVQHDQLERVRPLLDAFQPALLMSHFAESEIISERNAAQIAAFDKVRAALPNIPASLCNSSGIFLHERPFHDLVRPGYALYGGNPTPNLPNPTHNVVSLNARVLQVRDVAAGERVGYGGEWTAPRASRLATLSIGYADGLPRSGTAIGRSGIEAVVARRRCPFVGRLSMDLSILDVTYLPDGAVQRGDLAEILGETIGIDELGRKSGTIGYEILTRLGQRYARRYVGE